jgi:hypothetical protein
MPESAHSGGYTLHPRIAGHLGRRACVRRPAYYAITP